MGIARETIETELNRIDLAPRHADAAFAWMRANGQQGAHDIWYFGTAPHKKGAWAVFDKDGNRYLTRQAAALIYFFALNEKDGLNQKPPFESLRSATNEWGSHNFVQIIHKLKIDGKRFSESNDSETNTPRREDSMTETAKKLLEQFYQIIFHGPPGTGKTRAAKQVLKSIFGLREDDDDGLQNLQGEGEKGQWDIVQFHPSYNYEDFVRGVRVKTNDDNKVAYETVNRTFGDMCRKANAKENRNKKFALIIDEINRANVSAVLGELIYALEYRGEPVNTPYDAGGGKALTIPKNLYVIGTMNTADRTIGQIDYAVRRRFAFYPCPPIRRIIESKTNDNRVLKIYDDVQNLFRKAEGGGFLSSDFDAADVRIGHSYFLPREKWADEYLRQISQKIIWQVVPILREYAKDGVLTGDKLEDEIAKIKQAGKDLQDAEDLNDFHDSLGIPRTLGDIPTGKLYFYWHNLNRTRFGVAGVGRTALGIIRDFIKQNPYMDLAALQKEFEPIALGQHKRVTLWEENLSNSYFHKVVDRVSLQSSHERIAISAEWGATRNSEPQWKAFKEKMQSYGFSIGQCRLVNLGEGGKPGGESRSWESSFKHSFISARDKRYVREIKSLNVGDFLFVKLVDTANKKNGVIACAEVVAEAVPIAEFQTAEGPLAEVVVDGGQTYAQKHPAAFDGGEWCEHVVGVQWISEVKDRESVVKLSPKQYQRFPFSTDNIRRDDFKNLREKFQLSGYDE